MTTEEKERLGKLIDPVVVGMEAIAAQNPEWAPLASDWRKVAEIVRSEGEKAASGNGVEALRVVEGLLAEAVAEAAHGRTANALFIDGKVAEAHTRLQVHLARCSPDSASPVRSEGWKEIDEEGPPWGETVLLYIPPFDVTAGALTTLGDYFVGARGLIGKRVDLKPTHWMPLPAPPVSQEKP